MLSRPLFSPEEDRHFLPEGIVNGQVDFRLDRESLSDRGRGVEGIRIVLGQRKSCWDLSVVGTDAGRQAEARTRDFTAMSGGTGRSPRARSPE
jgi:hypothetical protein